MGRDFGLVSDTLPVDVSIHAPAWGATRNSNRSSTFQKVSIHAPAWGATDAAQASTLLKSFQFTRPHGARRPTPCASTRVSRFNSRARMGRDPSTRTLAHATGRFNSRARMGRDSACRWRTAGQTPFQFTRPHGARPASCAGVGWWRVSIHAPAWGATPLRAQKKTRPSVSIHAPAWGATYLAKWEEARSDVSIHAPAWGATSFPGNGTKNSWFQFTRPHGARRRDDELLMAGVRFNSRARMGRDTTMMSYFMKKRFQFTRPHGARLRPMYALPSFKLFQFTRPHGARRMLQVGIA